MKHIVTVIVCIVFASFTNAQISKKELLSVLNETLQKSRNAVPTATNIWRYDNSKNDYFKKDTITLNTARAYRKDYCIEVNWDFYKKDEFILEFIPECTEPPTRLISKKEDYITLKVVVRKSKIYLQLYNINGVFEIFRIIELVKNKPIIYNNESEFDYTLKLLRVK